MSTQATTEVPLLPDEEEITKAERLVMDAEEAVGNVARQVFAATNYTGEQEVTLAEIGRLFIFIREGEWMARIMLETFAKLDRATWGDLAGILREDRMLSTPEFNEYGTPNHRFDGSRWEPSN